MPGLMVYQSMAAAARSSRGAKVKPSMPTRDETPAAAPTHKLQAKPGRALRRAAAFAFELPMGQARGNAVDQMPADPVPKRLFGAGVDTERAYQSSGSDHEPSSMRLAAMVDEFMEDQATFGKCGAGRGDRAAELESKNNLGGELLEILKGLVACTSGAETSLLADVTEALALAKDQAGLICPDDGVDCIKRAVMRSLREAGYNAAVCKSRWDQAGGFPGGDYEYIDVVLEAKEAGGPVERLIVDVNFREQFEIARPTDRYSAMLQELPAVYVGSKERLQRIVDIMCDAVKESLKSRGMPLPPWRKPDYMRSKWFSAYKRTTNEAVHPHKRSESAIALSLSHTAFRDCSRWEPRFTNELERQLQQRVERRTSSSSSKELESTRKPTHGLAEALFEAGMSTLAKQQRPQQQQQMSLSLVAVS